ncbi:MAG TPA: DinB family protein [Phycisphaerales bacterium]|nr:DinB family protein [Phycisphaerales bacterium]
MSDHPSADSRTGPATGGTASCRGQTGSASGTDGEHARVAPVLAIALPKPQIDQFRSLDTLALIARFRRGIESFDRRIFFLDEARLDMAFLPDAGVGRWPIRVLVGHLADAQIATVHRVRRAVAEDHPVIAAWDENAFIDSGVYGRSSAAMMGGEAAPSGPGGSAFPLAGFVAVIHTLRRWMSEWLLTLTPAQWERAVLHPERGELSVRTLIEYDTWHLENHAWYLNAKVEKLLGVDAGEDLVEPADAPGGCGSGCGCAKR